MTTQTTKSTQTIKSTPTKSPTGKLNRVLIGLLVVQLAILAFQQLSGDEPKAVAPKKLFADLDPSKVTAVKIVDGGGDKKTIALRKLAGRWVLQSGGGYPTKKDKVSDLLAKLPALTAGAPVSSQPAHHRKLEVADGKYQRAITLTVEGKPKPVSFLLGSSPGLKRVHLRFAGSKDVYAAGELSTWDLGTAAYDWVETEYFKLEKKQIVALTVENSHGKLSLTKGEGDKWQLAELAEGKTLKQSEVDSLLGTASAITLQEPVGRKAEPAFGLQKPAVLLTVVTEKVVKVDGKDDAKKGDAKGEGAASQPAASQPTERRERKTFTVKIGAKKGDGFYAKASTSDFVVTVGSWLAEQLTKKKAADFIEQEKKAGDKADDNKPTVNPLGNMLGNPHRGHGHP